LRASTLEGDLAAQDGVASDPPSPPATGSIDPFFDESSEQSRVKASIVARYFPVWARVIAPSTKNWGGTRVAYIDLFAGPGRYQDGTKSTPIRILETIIADPTLRQMAVTLFNDAAQDHSNSLKAQVQALPGIEKLKHPPRIDTAEVGAATVELFDKVSIVPSFVFIDPWGYKGLSLPLLRAVFKDWGCDCVFFFDYNRINMGLTNPAIRRHMEAIFGATGLEQLIHDVEGLDPARREQEVLQALTRGLLNLGAKHVRPFRFKNDHGRTTHELIFVTKHFKGLELMREIMAEHSTSVVDGVAALEHSLEDLRSGAVQLTFAESPLDELKRLLVTTYAGREFSVRELFERDSVGRIYRAENYKEALRRLEGEGHITANPPADRRLIRKGVRTMADKTRIRFPPA
jgi:three-Cys-motif partner protein